MDGGRKIPARKLPEWMSWSLGWEVFGRKITHPYQVERGLPWKSRDDERLLGLSITRFWDVKFVGIRMADIARGVVGHVQERQKPTW